tara:strand:- start:246751 stop:248691 length:1941 start_codon:yes stop_codon:yes gene_type:complete
MTTDQIAIIAVLLVTVAMFLWGRWRHDMVAMGALLACVFIGLVPAGKAFAGFGHPAVITVACVLVLGYGLQISGAVDILAKRFLPASAGPTVSILALITLAAVLSGFMNNVGALALLMPIAIQMAGKHDLPVGKVLMPLAFGSILGGMSTLIGTPPNLIVSGYRASTGAGSFSMFDFSPVGASVALVGVLFVGLIGWRIVPTRKQNNGTTFDSGAYISELRIVEGSKASKKSLREVEEMLEEFDAQIVGLVRHDIHISAPSPWRVLRDGDILMIEIEPASLSSALSSLGLRFEEDVPIDEEKEDDEKKHNEENKEQNKEQGQEEDPRAEPAGNILQQSAQPDEEEAEKAEQAEEEKDKDSAADVITQEFVVSPNAGLVHRSASDVQLRSLYGINLLAISREGERSIKRLRVTKIQAGDVLLVQGPSDALSGFASQFGCLPLIERDIRIPQKGQALKASVLMTLAVLATVFGILPASVAFAAGALAFLAFGIVPIRSLYTSVDWPVIVLLGAMLPVADAMSSTGAADMIARFMLDNVAQGHAVIGLISLLVVTMFLSDLMNNAATAAVMCPIAVSTAEHLNVSADAFLMAIAVGASCAFLTPVGHQNNTLILGPSGFRFGDYWRLGIVLEAIVLLVSVPLLLWFWPL